MSRVVGIDLGTTNSCVAFVDGGQATVIPNREGSRTTPSVVTITDDGERRVGSSAKRQAVTSPENTLFAIKRLMGARFDSDITRRHGKLVPYRVISHENGDAWVHAGGKDFSPPEVSAMILRNMREIAEDYLGEEVTEAVVTVPAYFNDAQRAATKAAGKIAGLDVRRIINEPTAAALAYGVTDDSAKKVVVYDLGGGTFDVSILDIREGVYRVLSTAGDTHLGGEDIDLLLVEELIKRFKDSSGIDLEGDRVALQRLKEQAEKAKHELSTSLDTSVNIPFIAVDTSGQPVHLETTLKRSDLEILSREIIERTITPCKQALSDAGLSKTDIDEVLLVGGQTRMPFVRRTVSEFFGKEPHKGLNPDEVVASGAAIQGASLAGEVDEVFLLDVTPLSLGVETGGGVFTTIIPRNTTIPTNAKEIFTTSVNNQSFVPVHVLQGERQMAADNKTLAKFELAPIPPAPAGAPEIEVAFDIDGNGMVEVTAKDLRTGREQSIRVVANSGLTEDEIERIIGESEAHKENDEKRRELAELKNSAQALLFSSEQALEECIDLVPEDVATRVREDAEALRAASEEGDALAMREALQALELSAYAIAESMFQDE